MWNLLTRKKRPMVNDTFFECFHWKCNTVLSMERMNSSMCIYPWDKKCPHRGMTLILWDNYLKLLLKQPIVCWWVVCVFVYVCAADCLDRIRNCVEELLQRCSGWFSWYKLLNLPQCTLSFLTPPSSVLYTLSPPLTQTHTHTHTRTHTQPCIKDKIFKSLPNIKCCSSSNQHADKQSWRLCELIIIWGSACMLVCVQLSVCS